MGIRSWLGDPGIIPAGHTDLVLPAIAEEWGLPGVLAIASLFTLLVARSFRIAVRARDEYSVFLSAGLGILLALEMLLISGGVLGAIPLSGVVSPFLSSRQHCHAREFSDLRDPARSFQPKHSQRDRVRR